MNGILFLVLLLPTFVFAQTTTEFEALKRRIEQLELQQEELLLLRENEPHQVNSFLRDNLTLGGFFESGITALEGSDTDFQVMNDTNVIALNIAADFNDNLRFVSQFLTALAVRLDNPHNDPRATPNDRRYGTPFIGSVLTQGYLEFSRPGNLRIQAGMGYVPFGYYPQQRELVLYVRRLGPQLLRTNDLFSPLWSGLHLQDSIGGNTHTGYHLYTMYPMDDSNVLGVGGRLWKVSTNERVGGGLSAQVSKYQRHTSEVLGADVRIHWDRLIVTSEYAVHMAEEDDPWSAYVEPSYRLANDDYLIYTFVDYSRNTLNQTSAALSDPIAKWEYGGGINWLPTSYTRLRTGFTIHHYTGSRAGLLGKERDYVSLDFSAGVAF